MKNQAVFFSLKLILYLVFLGILPSIYIIKVNILKVPVKKFLITTSLTLLFMVIVAFANASNWLWIDKNSKTLGGLAMPWSYTVNTSLYYIHEYKKMKKKLYCLMPPSKTTRNL